jgi:hypothetical protein
MRLIKLVTNARFRHLLVAWEDTTTWHPSSLRVLKLLAWIMAFSHIR